MMLKEIVCEHVSQTDLLGDMVRFSCVCVCVYVCVCMYVGVCVRGGGECMHDKSCCSAKQLRTSINEQPDLT